MLDLLGSLCPAVMPCQAGVRWMAGVHACYPMRASLAGLTGERVRSSQEDIVVEVEGSEPQDGGFRLHKRSRDGPLRGSSAHAAAAGGDAGTEDPRVRRAHAAARRCMCVLVVRAWGE